MELEKNIEYSFKNKELLDNALRHSSFVNEQPNESLEDNERLEFLGDAVLSLIIGHLLMIKYPKLNEGDLSRTRANLVNASQLAIIAKNIDLGRFIYLGKGEIQTHGRKKHSILADALEALLAAIYLDGGFNAAFNFISQQFASQLKSITTTVVNNDYKSQLQELIQEKHKVTPEYNVVDEKGPDHDKTFEVKLNVCDIQTTGSGKNKKMAEQNAAEKALQILKKRSP